MQQNKYDDDVFFNKYSNFPRSQKGLAAAGEWRELEKMLPDFNDKRVLDLGCGFGWHCMYAAQHGAAEVVGVDISEKMLNTAKEKNNHPNIEYLRSAIEDVKFEANSFNIVLSSLALHYIESFPTVCEKVYSMLSNNGDFVFSIEHPVFTAQGIQDWCYDTNGKRLHWPVDNYFSEGKREAVFLGEKVFKYHKTLTTYMNDLLKSGFAVTGLTEPRPPQDWLSSDINMADELRRPMMLIISAKKH